MASALVESITEPGDVLTFVCFSLQVVETLPSRPGTCQALTLDSGGLSVAPHALNKPDLLEDLCACLPVCVGGERPWEPQLLA